MGVYIDYNYTWECRLYNTVLVVRVHEVCGGKYAMGPDGPHTWVLCVGPHIGTASGRGKPDSDRHECMHKFASLLAAGLAIESHPLCDLL